MAKSPKRPKGGRPKGRRGRGGTGPGPAYRPGGTGRGSTHKGGSTTGGCMLAKVVGAIILAYLAAATVALFGAVVTG